MAYSIEEIAGAAVGLSQNEMAALIALLVQQREEKQLNEVQNEALKRDQITAARATLSALLGDPNGTTPDESTIYGMIRHSNETLQQHSGLAIKLLLEGLATTVRATRDLAFVVGS